MPDRFSLDPVHTAVLSLDCQTGIVSISAKDDKEGFLARVASLLDYARAGGMAVIHVRVGFRRGLPEVSFRNPLIKVLTPTSGTVPGTAGSDTPLQSPQKKRRL